MERTARERHALRSTLIFFVGVAAIIAIPRLAEFWPALLRTTPGPNGWRIFVESKNDWSVTYPGSWHAQRIAERARTSRYQPATYGILISNVKHEMDHPEGGSNHWRSSRFDTRGLPSNLVAVQIVWSYFGGFTPTCPEWGSRFPLSLEDATRKTSSTGANGTEQATLELAFTARYQPMYSITAWLGSEASDRDQAILDKIVESISFEDMPYPRSTSGAVSPSPFPPCEV